MDASHDANTPADTRRHSTRSLTRSTSDSRSDGSESYDMSDLGVADGFRPQASTDASTPPPQPMPTLLTPPQRRPSSSSTSQPTDPEPSTSQSSSSPSRSPSNNNLLSPPQDAGTPAEQGASIPRPSSVSKNYRPHDSLTLHNDGSGGGLGGSAGRSQALAGSSEAPNGGLSSQPSDPSNSFRAFQQRTNSGNTPSTSDGSRTGEYSNHQSPAHPYALYLQSTEPLDPSHAHQIPVGFSGMGDSYQRQIGPDGEEAGALIGPMGHMEELPPYTRYPEPAHLRGEPSSTPTTTDDPSSAGNAATASTPTAENSSPSGDVVVGAHHQGSASSNGLAQTGSRPSVRSGETSDASHEINTAARGVIEKSHMNKWQRRARKRAWGVVPYWAIGLLLLLLLVIGILLGVLLGVLLGKKEKYDGDDNESNAGPAPTTDIDRLPSAPPDLIPLATGLFDLPPLDVSQAPKQCFDDTTQAQAWSCEMPFRYFSMDVRVISGAADVENYEFTLTAVNGSDSVYVWGTQPPDIPDPVPLRLVNDAFEPSRGPAWWRKLEYNKRVIIPEIRFSERRKRDRGHAARTLGSGYDPTRFMTGNPGPVEGEKAWFCDWPKTTMEVFIFPSQNTSFPITSVSGTPTTTTTAPSTSSTPYDSTPPYPQVVKFLERRQFNVTDSISTAATCKQVKIVNGGKDAEPVIGDDGSPIVVEVIESLSSYQDQLAQSERSRHSDPDKRSQEAVNIVPRERLELTDCGCLWWSI